MSEYVSGASAKEKQITDDFVTLKVGICIDDLDKSKMKKAANGKSYLNLDITRRREVGQYGDTHSIKYDTWEPKEKSDAVNAGVASNDGGSLPF